MGNMGTRRPWQAHPGLPSEALSMAEFRHTHPPRSKNGLFRVSHAHPTLPATGTMRARREPNKQLAGLCRVAPKYTFSYL